MRMWIQFTIIIIFLSCLNLNAYSINNENKILKKHLDDNIYQLYSKKLTKTEVLSRFGKPSLVENSIYYYELDGFKYALMIKFKDLNIIEFQYTLNSKKPLYFDDLKSHLVLKSISPVQGTTHQSGSYIEFVANDKNLKYRFKNNSKKILSKIIYKIEDRAETK